MANIWITGAKGFIGRHLARHLSQAGHAVHGIGHGLWPEREPAAWGLASWVNGDVDHANLDGLRRQVGVPSLVFHLAGGSSVGTSLANPLEDFERTVTSTARLLEWMRTRAGGSHFVGVSSAAVYGAGYDGSIGEEAATRPYSPYGHHKLMMEQLSRSHTESFGTRCTIVRLFSVYGSWLKKQLLWDMCSQLAAGTDEIHLGGTGAECRDWVEIRDVVRLLRAVAHAPEQPFTLLNGGSGAGTSVATIAQEVLNAWGLAVPVAFSGERRAGDPFSLVARGDTLAARGFTWEISTAAGIANYVDWFKAHRS